MVMFYIALIYEGLIATPHKASSALAMMLMGDGTGFIGGRCGPYIAETPAKTAFLNFTGMRLGNKSSVKFMPGVM